MENLKNKVIVVAGGTGNVGSFIVRELLRSGSRVVVPSRSEEKAEDLKNHLQNFNTSNVENLFTIEGQISDEETSKELLKKITSAVGKPDGAISTLGRFIPAPSLLTVEMEKYQTVMDNYLKAHFSVARLFLREFKSSGGSFVFINGPLALKPREGAGLVSISTAAQQMLFKALAMELQETEARVSELMTYAYIRNRETQPGSNVSGEAVGVLASWMVSDQASQIHGETIHLKSNDKLKELGLELPH